MSERDEFFAVMEVAIVRARHRSGEPACTLAIGTRVRIDDREHPCHDLVGIVSGYGPGGSIEVALESGTTEVSHRSQLALVDDTLPDCETCRGAGTVALFSSLADCHACGGSGVTS